MKYKNTTKGVLKFRAFDKKMVKKVFELKADEEVELGSKAECGGLELVLNEKKTKIKESE